MIALRCLAPALPLFALPLFALPEPSEAADRPPLGTWLTEGGESRVEIAPCEDRFCGSIVWLKTPSREDGGPIVDSNNGDPALRSRQVMGLRIMEGFVLSDQGALEGGTIYNPEDGNTYEPVFTPRDDGSLQLEACVLFICRSQTWVRVE